MVCRDLAERHHIRSRGSGGGDEEWNIVKLCRRHHTEIHQIGNNRFGKKYPSLKNWLLSNGWEFNELLGKWRHG